jgi:glycosyltransferase involved in cell wall biosynthesis
VTAQRFCFLTTFYPPFNFGGDGIGVQRLARGLATRGHDVTVIHDADAYHVLHQGPPPDETEPDPSGVRVVTLRSRTPLLSTLLTQQTGRPIVNGRRLARLLTDGRFDVVNFNNISLVGGPGVLAYGGRAIKIYLAHEHWLVCPTHVLWRHDREPCDARECFRCQLQYRRPPQLWRYTGLLDRHLAQVDRFVAMSEFSRAKHREFGFPRDMTVLPNFLPDPDPAAPPIDAPRPHDRPYFLFVGRLERIKGLDDVIIAFRNYADADLLIVGDGTHGEALRRIDPTRPNVRFVGRVPAESLGPYYQHAIALLAPSVGFETFGLTLIEAFSRHTPVIARRIGPFPEIVHQSRGGELFETADELLAAMDRMQHDPERRAQAARAGYDAYRTRWSERVVVPRYLEIVDETRERRGAA